MSSPYLRQHLNRAHAKVAADKLPTLIWDEPTGTRTGPSKWLPIIEKLIATPNRWARITDGTTAKGKRADFKRALANHGYNQSDFQFRTTSGTSPNTRGRREYLFVMYEPGVFHWPGES